MLDLIVSLLLVGIILTSAVFWKLTAIFVYAIAFLISPLIRVYSILALFLFIMSIVYNN